MDKEKEVFDWLPDFLKKVNHSEDLRNLKKQKFNGYIRLNFFDGRFVNANKYTTITPIKIGGTD